MTKQEVYAGLIEIQKSSGQGLSGIVRVLGENANNFRQYLDELIEEGLVECYDGGGSLGHPESNRWYMPTKGYNVWEDGIENGGGDTSFLTYVRFYLGKLDHDQEPDGREKIHKWLSPSAQILIQNPEFMKSYSEWLLRNSEELQVMINLVEDYDYPVIEFSTDEIEFIKSRSWYSNNKTISECLIDSNETKNISEQLAKLYREKASLCNGVQKQQALAEAKENEDEVVFRKKLNKWLESQNQTKNIQEVFNVVMFNN